MGATQAYKDPRVKPLDFLKGEIRFSPGYEILAWANSPTDVGRVSAYYILTRTPEGQVTVMAGTYWPVKGRLNFMWRDSWRENAGIHEYGMPLAWLERLTPLLEVEDPQTLAEVEAAHRALESRWGELSEDERRECGALEDKLDDLDPDRRAREYRQQVRAYHDRLAQVTTPGCRVRLPGWKYGGLPLGEVVVVGLRGQVYAVQCGRAELHLPRRAIHHARLI